jgi:hypothetical protein
LAKHKDKREGEPKGEFVILSPTTASEEMLRMAAANGDQRATRELTRRQRVAA